MKKLLIIDADSIIYYVAYNFRNKKVKKMVELNVNKFISDLLTNSGATDYIGFYGSKEDDALPNFRYDIYEDYKSNRPPTPDFIKKWRPTIHEAFKEKWNFIPVEGMEADDAVGITYTKYKDDYDEIIIATADKDLRQFNCTFYDFNKHEMTEIGEFEAAYNKYHQMIMGDSGDHIPGIPGIGKVGAKKLLKECTTPEQLKLAVMRAYYNYFDKEISKIKKNIIADKIKEIADDDSNKNLTEAQLKRKARIASKQAIEDAIEEALPAKEWGYYYIQQCRLISMLTEAPDYFTIPDPIASPFGDLEKATAKPLTREERKEAISRADDFLTI